MWRVVLWGMSRGPFLICFVSGGTRILWANRGWSVVSGCEGKSFRFADGAERGAPLGRAGAYLGVERGHCVLTHLSHRQNHDRLGLLGISKMLR
jgi:hypothetical protein